MLFCNIDSFTSWGRKKRKKEKKKTKEGRHILLLSLYSLEKLKLVKIRFYVEPMCFQTWVFKTHVFSNLPNSP